MRTSSLSKSLVSLTAIMATAFFARVVSAEEAPAAAPEPDVAHPSEGRAGGGVAVGMDNGIMGRSYEQGLRLRIPVSDHFALAARGLSSFGSRTDEFTWYIGGRAEIVGHSPVYLNLVRIYGGGGPEIISRVQGPGGDRTVIGAGGQFGFEFFLSRGLSFFAEIGGHSGDEQTAGGTALAGMMIYPFTGR